jgi:predicted signal transduction protein with EAL and GGDEF domain
MFHSQLQVLFQPIIDLHRELPAAFEVSFRLRSGASASRLFERARAAGRGVEIESEAVELAIRIARRLPWGALALPLAPELLEADPLALRSLLLETDRPVWAEIDSRDAVVGETEIASLRVPDRIAIILTDALAPDALQSLLLIAPEIIKVSSPIPQAPLLSLARHLGARLCRELIYEEPRESLIAAGYTLVQGRRFGAPREARAWSRPGEMAG